MKPRISTLLKIILVPIATFMIFVFGWGAYMRGCRSSQIPFDSVAWKSAEIENSDVRARMIRDVLKVLKGMNISKVDEMLGQPTKTDKWKNWDRVYWLRYVLIDSEWLVINLQNDVVTDFAVVED